jgi:hypothetical protein
VVVTPSVSTRSDSATMRADGRQDPRAVTRGSRPPSHIPPMRGIPAGQDVRFDWYAATILDDPGTVLEGLSEGLRAEVAPGRAVNGYREGYDLRRDGSTVARVLYGGNGGWPHAFASSDDTDLFVGAVRERWGDRHRVTRMDAAVDFDGPRAWDRLYAICLRLADARHLKIDQAGDWHRKIDGRTFYVGGRKSAVFARLYEKGKQLRGRALDGGEGISTDLVRLEVQVRPEGYARTMAARAEPSDAFGYADWTRELGRLVLGVDVERVHIKERRESDDARAIEWMVRQYGEHLERLAAGVGGWPAVGEELRRVKARQDRRRGL